MPNLSEEAGLGLGRRERTRPKEREKEIGGRERDWGRLGRETHWGRVRKEQRHWACPLRERNEGREIGIEKRERTGLEIARLGLSYGAELAERENR